MSVCFAPIFADLTSNIGNIVVSGLAVAGAGAFGYFLTRGTIWLVGKFAFNKKPPQQVSRILGFLGAVATALLVAGLLFHGQGGGGWGFGPGFGFGTGSGGSSNGSSATEPKSGQSGDERENTSTATPKTANPLRIRMLGGKNVKMEGGNLVIYQPEPGNEAYTFERLKPLIRDRMQEKPGLPAIHEIVIVIEKESVAHNHDAVLRLDQFAKDQGLTVTIQLPANP
jgi:hypothetical protein